MLHCKQLPFLAGRPLNLKNLVNELPGWLQVQANSSPDEQCSSAYVGDEINERNKAKRRARIQEKQLAQTGVARSSYDDDDYVDDTFYGSKVSDAEMAEKIAYFSAHFGDEANVEENQRKAVQLQRELGISREKLYDCLFGAQVMADKKGKTMGIFFEQLRLIVEERKAQAAM
jgi:hypothetical protein